MLRKRCIYGGKRGVGSEVTPCLTLDSCSTYMITYMQTHSCILMEHFMCPISAGVGNRNSVKTIKCRQNMP
jgi:hypothetical protein